MTTYAPEMYTLKMNTSASVSANRFDGTEEMAHWLVDQDEENLRLVRNLAGEIAIFVENHTGTLTLKKGDWIVNNDSTGSWNVYDDKSFNELLERVNR